MARILTLVLIVVAAVDAQVRRDDMTPMTLAYTTGVGDDNQTLLIDLEVAGVTRPSLRVAMPNWTPGSYSLRRFGAQVTDLTATAGDTTLDVTRLDHQTWSIETGGARTIRVRYSVPPTRFWRYSGGVRKGRPTTGFHYQAPVVYVYPVGHTDAPVTSRYDLPVGWKVANGLLRTADPMVRTARNYDTFIDCPTIVGRFIQKDFDVDGTIFEVVVFGNEQKYDFDHDALAEVCRRIVSEQGAIFGSFPFPHYTFLFSLGSGGGLEHLSSTSIGLSANRLRSNPASAAGITSHEFFHTWNVKRIRPESLGPFEYWHENYTGNLWVAEGWTSYYGDLTLVRCGMTPRDRFLASLQGMMRRELGKEGRKVHSVTWASRNVWHRSRQGEPARVSYYSKGEILALCIDLKIRHVTDNKKSLDDVMRFMNRWFAERGVGYRESDVERACTAVSNHDFSEFFARHVDGTLDPPLARVLSYAGIDYREERHNASFPFTYRERGGAISVRFVRARAGEKIDLKRGDVIVAVGGQREFDLRDMVKTGKGGDEIVFTIQRAGVDRDVKVALRAADLVIPSLRWTESPTELQGRIREDWLSAVAR